MSILTISAQGELVRGWSLWAIIGLPILACFAFSIYRFAFHPLSSIPGPGLARLTSLWLTYHYMMGNWHTDILELHDKYGPVVRIAPNEIAFVDASVAKQLYAHGTQAQKSAWYKTWHPPGYGVTFFAEINRQVHALSRKRVSAAYSMSAILRYERYIQNCLSLCWEKLAKAAVDGDNVVDMSNYAEALAWDVVGELAYGEQFGHLRTNTDVDRLRENNSGAFWLSANLGHVWGRINLVVNPITNSLAAIMRTKPPVDAFFDYIEKRVTVRRASPKLSTDRHDMLSHFLQMKSLDGSSSASMSEIVIEAANITGAGADTTSAGIRTCLYFIGTHDVVYSNLQAEIDGYYEEHKLGEHITYKQAQHLPYLRAVVSESLRLFPSITYQLPREAPVPGITISGYFIPPGYNVGTSPIAQNRDPRVFGNQRNSFIPERWLESSQQTAALESASMTFGGNGPRGCVGKNIALVEIYKFVAQFLFLFDFQFVEPDNPWIVASVWNLRQRNMKMRVTVRDNHHHFLANASNGRGEDS